MSHSRIAHPPLTKEQAVEEAERDLQKTRSRLNSARRQKSASRRATELVKVNSEIAEATARLKEVRKSYVPESTTRLMPFVFKDIEIGKVGRIADQADQRNVFCVQILEPNEMLAYIRSFVQVGVATSRSSGAKEVESPMFILKGSDTTKVAEGQQLQTAHDVVVTGQETYEDTQGATHTVFVVEVFDPDQPFK